MFAIAMAVLPVLQAVQQPPPTKWTLGGSNAAGYRMEASGSPVTAPGATLSLRAMSAAGAGFGSVSSTLATETFAGRRVRISADIQADDVSGSASLWVRADGGKRVLAFDNGFDQALKGTAGPTHLEVSVFVPKSATGLMFGLLLSGRGAATARNFRIAAGATVAPDAPMAAAVEAELDSALRIVRRVSLWRDTVTWDRVEPDVRAAAAGAETTADAYAAIRYLLSRLGDHHSLLMRPRGAQSFTTGGADNAQPVVRVQQTGIGYVAVPGIQAPMSRPSRRMLAACRNRLHVRFRAARAPAVGSWTCAAIPAATCGRCSLACVPSWATPDSGRS